VKTILMPFEKIYKTLASTGGISKNAFYFLHFTFNSPCYLLIFETKHYRLTIIHHSKTSSPEYLVSDF